MKTDDANWKRESSPTPSPPSSRKRAKTEHSDLKLDCYTPPPLPLSAPHGVERIPLPPSLNPNRLSSQYLGQLASERTDILRRQGRHVVGLPVVLNDGIILNWMRQKLGSVSSVRSHNTDISVVRQSDTWFAEQRNEKHCPAAVQTGSGGGGSGTSVADAIIIDSDEDIPRVSSLPRADKAIKLPSYRGTSSNQDVIINSDLDIELPPPVCSENEVDDDPENPHSADMSVPVPSAPPPGCVLTREGGAFALSGLRSDGTDLMTSSHSEADGAGGEVINRSRISSRHAKPSSLPSLRPIRNLLAKGKPRDGPKHQVRPRRIVVAPGVSVSSKQRKGSPEEAPSITSSESEEESDCPASDPQLKRVPLPKTDYGRARRLAMPESADLPLVAVTMRGDCHFIERKRKYRISGYSLPNPGVFRHVEDVCMVGNTAVLGCDKGTHQISFLSVAGRPKMIDITWSPHSNRPRYQDMQKRGVSRLAAIHAENGHIKFLSGGYDGTIHEWTAGIEKLNEPRSRKLVSHASAQRKLHITDLNRSKTTTHPLSNDIQQIHVHPQAAYVTLLEVRHLDRQIQLYDSRKGGFDGEPCLSFGQRNTNGKFSGTYTRGSVHLVHFAMASEDGGVLLWDFRNSKLCPKRAVIERRFQQAEKVVHAIFADRDIVALGQGVVTFFEDYLAR